MHVTVGSHVQTGHCGRKTVLAVIYRDVYAFWYPAFGQQYADLICSGGQPGTGVGKDQVCVFLSDLLANVISLLWEIWFPGSRMVVSAGASGAIFGVIGGLLYVVGVNRGRLEDLSSRQLATMVLFSLYFGFTSTGVNNVAHVGGLVSGIVMAWILYRRPQRSEWWMKEDF